MSVTTTDNARVNALRHVLADYDLHHDQPLDSESRGAPEPNPQETAITSNNPPGWETQWRRVPAHRPVDPTLLNGDRNQASNAIERNFIRVMFSGVYLQATVSSLWRATGGKLSDRVFRIKVGGEW
ncbi:uncharacterized protein RCC_04397 [Ramularia collo-cygni]|uniref:Uncharacterized protein n=1 Tax=Ramularia collo-cygni TaxID=112498 RepID=A0A2D3VDB9_9PEZI|nr:uncharacterized protein RCC_04397 [Ramularia collo-cygni]CZT18553.1 uncharacterized protein RCC_04397 [Ramularia collo-cygni]